MVARIKNLGLWSGGGSSISTSRCWEYFSDEDTISQIRALGYFDIFKDKLNKTDLIYAQGTDGENMFIVFTERGVGPVRVFQMQDHGNWTFLPEGQFYDGDSLNTASFEFLGDGKIIIGDGIRNNAEKLGRNNIDSSSIPIIPVHAERLTTSITGLLTEDFVIADSKLGDIPIATAHSGGSPTFFIESCVAQDFAVKFTFTAPAFFNQQIDLILYRPVI
jgi:hypothetical protein